MKFSNNFVGPYFCSKTCDFHRREHSDIASLSSSSLSKSAADLLFNDSFFEELVSLTKNDMVGSSSNKEGNLLNKYFLQHGCNKGVAHNYPSFYNSLLFPFRDQVELFVEIGIGSPNKHEGAKSRMGENYPFGSSLRGWKDYFPSSEIIGVDLDPNVMVDEERITSCYGDQLNPFGMLHLKTLISKKSGADVILDDGLHEHVSNMNTFISLWEYLRPGGIYLIEDMSESIFSQNMKFLRSLNIDAVIFGAELQSDIKSDNRIIAILKNPQ